MWRNISLIYPTVGFLLLSVAATLGVGYTMNYSTLQDVLREQVRLRADELTKRIQKDIQERVREVDRFKDSWMVNIDRNSKQHDHGSPAQPGESPDDFRDSWQRLKKFFPFWKLDFLLVLDATGKMTHRMPADFPVSDLFDGAEQARAMAEVREKGELMRAGLTNGKWSIQAFAAIPGAGGGVVVFGHYLDRMVGTIHARNPQQRFFLARDRETIGTVEGFDDINFQQVVATVESGSSGIDFDDSAPWNLYYTPIKIIDQTLALVVPVEPESARRTLTASREKLVFTSLFIIAILVAAAFMINRLIMSPLRRLNETATNLVRACAVDDDHDLHRDKQYHGNEIVQLEQALKATSTKLYVHLDRFQESRELLEDLALQDRLTDLLNHRMFLELLGRALLEARRKNRRLAVLLMDIEEYEDWHSVLPGGGADKMILEIVNRLREGFRGEDLLFRIHNTEFAAFLPESGSPEQVLALAERIATAIREPYEVDGHKLNVAMWVGVSIYPDHGEDLENLVKRAQVALKVAMENDDGKHCSIYSPEMANLFDAEK